MHTLYRVIITLITSMVLLTAQAEIYKWTDENGKVHYSDTVADNQSAETINVDNVNTFTNVNIYTTPGWQGFYKPPKKNGRNSVVMFSRAGCGYCDQAKQYFEQQNIPYVERRIDLDKEAYNDFEALNGNGVPLILFGEQRMEGFSVESFTSFYQQGLAAP